MNHSTASKLRIQRKYGESFMIGNDVKVTLLKPERGGMVSVQVEAPRSWEIHRQEVYNQRYLKPSSDLDRT